MILDIRSRTDKKGTKILEKFICDDFEIIDGYMQFSLTKGRWVEFERISVHKDCLYGNQITI